LQIPVTLLVIVLLLCGHRQGVAAVAGVEA
jgi:hypothetical protein